MGTNDYASLRLLLRSNYTVLQRIKVITSLASSTGIDMLVSLLIILPFSSDSDLSPSDLSRGSSPEFPPSSDTTSLFVGCCLGINDKICD